MKEREGERKKKEGAGGDYSSTATRRGWDEDEMGSVRTKEAASSELRALQQLCLDSTRGETKSKTLLRQALEGFARKRQSPLSLKVKKFHRTVHESVRAYFKPSLHRK